MSSTEYYAVNIINNEYVPGTEVLVYIGPSIATRMSKQTINGIQGYSVESFIHIKSKYKAGGCIEDKDIIITYNTLCEIKKKQRSKP